MLVLSAEQHAPASRHEISEQIHGQTVEVAGVDGIPEKPARFAQPVVLLDAVRVSSVQIKPLHIGRHHAAHDARGEHFGTV